MGEPESMSKDTTTPPTDAETTALSPFYISKNNKFKLIFFFSPHMLIYLENLMA